MKAENWWLTAIIGITLLVIAIININDFRLAHPVWFWLLVALIILVPICYIFRRAIRDMLTQIYDKVSNSKKPKNNGNSN